AGMKSALRPPTNKPEGGNHMSETQKKKPAGTFVKLPDEVFTTLFKEARARGLTVQEMLIDAATKLSTSIQSGERSIK
ncbi:hypothetical protein, partial [Enterobacter bugandensis]|uniref:hypothetical protein n=2 Tax=Gammaproteobacteria TaxID=1236 RepID=UPI0031B9DFD4